MNYVHYCYWKEAGGGNDSVSFSKATVKERKQGRGYEAMEAAQAFDQRISGWRVVASG